MADNGQKLGAEIESVMVLEAGEDGSTGYFVCTSAKITMELNQIPSATVVIGAGIGIRDVTRTQSPEELLAMVLGKRDRAYRGMVPCALYEAPTMSAMKSLRGARKVFSGYIATGSVVYNTGNPTIKQIRLQCMNKAIKLYRNPIGATAECTGEYVTDMATSNGNREFSANNPTSNVEDATRYPVVERITGPDSGLSKDSTIVQRVAKIMALTIQAQNYKTLKGGAAGSDWESTISECFCGDTRLNDPPDGISYDPTPSLSDAYNLALANAFGQYIASGSIYTALTSSLLTDYFMLMFVPRWSDKDFMLEIQPSRAWAPRKIIKLPIGCISGIDAAYNPTACLQTPDVFVVNFSDAVSTFFGQQSYQITGRPGVYAANKEAQRIWRNALEHRTSPAAPTADKFYAKYYAAPDWMTPLVMASGSTDSVRRSVRDTATPIVSGENSGKTQPKGNTVDVCDMVAEALFTYIYGCEDKCSVDLLLSTRFGMTSGIELEKNLGEAVDIEFQGSEKVLGIRGVIQQLTYDYTCGAGSARARYNMQLCCVRPLGDDETPIECPVYKSGDN